MTGTLYVVATPIGNLEDLTPRARETLASVPCVAAEDTRHTGRLLMHIGAKPRLLALHDHNETRAVGPVVERLLGGESVALVSDAGTPLISDPGYRLVAAAHVAGIPVVPVAGSSAVTAALSVAGLPTDRFCFEGFVPSRPVARRVWLEALRGEVRTLVVFESVHRIAASLAEMAEILGANRPAFIGREMTKLHEQCTRATLGELSTAVEDGDIVEKGEFVVVIAGADAAETGQAPSLDVERLLLELDEELPARQAAGIAARLSGEKKNALYQRLLQLRKRHRP